MSAGKIRKPKATGEPNKYPNPAEDEDRASRRIADAGSDFGMPLKTDVGKKKSSPAKQGPVNPPTYNPLDRKNLGRSVADALLQTEPIPLRGIARFRGAGIYALYYTGSHPAYGEIAKRNRDGFFLLPIYVGKAVPAGARKGHLGEGIDPGQVLVKRLQEHEESIRQAPTLDLDDFWCRFVVVEDIWIPLGESLLIAKYSPLWNKMLDGFGNHDPGAGRYQGLRPKWDVLHPGRSWADKCRARSETSTQIQTELQAHLRLSSLPPIPTLLGTDE